MNQTEIDQTLRVGNVLGSAWGYGATNRDFYLVTAVSKTGRVKVTPIKKVRVSTADIEANEWSDYVSPRVELTGSSTGYKQVFTSPEGSSFTKMSTYERAYKVAETGDEAEAMTFTETNSYYI